MEWKCNHHKQGHAYFFVVVVPEEKKMKRLLLKKVKKPLAANIINTLKKLCNSENFTL